jgi:ATP-dependent DNA ligase
VTFEDGRTSFAKLQRRMHVRDPEAAIRTGVPVSFYLFDVLHVDGYDVTGIELRHHKMLLRRLLSFGELLRFTDHRDGGGEAYWREACGKGWEGVMAKRADSPYVHGRSRDWLKFKCVNSQEFVIGGFTDPKGSRHGFGALLLGYYRGDNLVYAGKVGTGFDDDLLTELRRRLDELEQDDPPFTVGRLPEAGRIGCAPSWWPRSASPSGPRTGTCAIPGSSDSGATSSRTRWGGRSRTESRGRKGSGPEASAAAATARSIGGWVSGWPRLSGRRTPRPAARRS